MASIHKTPQGAFRVRWRDNTGTMRSKTFPKHAAARTYARQVEEAMAGGNYVDPKRGKVLFADWADDVMASRVNLRESTLARDRTYMQSLISPVFGGVRLDVVQPSDIQTFVSRLIDRGYAPATVRKAYELVSKVFAAAVTEGMLARSPARGVNLPPLVRDEMRFLTPDEIRLLAETIHPRFAALVVTAGHTGLRFGELAALTTSRLDLVEGSVRVTETMSDIGGRLVVGPPKTAAARRNVALPGFLIDLLTQHLEMFPGGWLVFTATKGGPIRPGNLRKRYWAPAVEQSVGGPLRFHDLRHSHVATLIDQNTHPKVIAQRLGHTSVRTVLDVYGHLFEGMDRDVADRLDDSLRDRSVPFLFLPDRQNVVALPARR